MPSVKKRRNSVNIISPEATKLNFVFVRRIQDIKYDVESDQKNWIYWTQKSWESMENISMFSTCSEFTPRAPIPDGRMTRIMQPGCEVVAPEVEGGGVDDEEENDDHHYHCAGVPFAPEI